MESLIDDPDLNHYDLYHLVWQHPKIARDEMRALLAEAQRTVNKPEVIEKRIKRDLKEKFRKQIRAKAIENSALE